VFIQAGFQESAVDVKKALAFCPAIAECILKEQKTLQSNTLVIGRRGISKKRGVYVREHLEQNTAQRKRLLNMGD
jgi:hypothetical protein